MNNETLREQLEQLHGELRQTETVDVRQRELLKTLEDDIQELLGREQNQPHHYCAAFDIQGAGTKNPIALQMPMEIVCRFFLGREHRVQV